MVETIPKLEQTILDLLRQLPPDRQKQVMDFVRFLDHETRQDNDEDDLLITGFGSLKTQLGSLEQDVPKEELASWLASFDKV